MKKIIENKEKGFTVIEMIMAILVFTIGIAGFTFLFSRTWKVNSYTLKMGQSSLSASQGVSKMVYYIRKSKQADNGSYPIKSADSDDLVVYSDYNKDGITERLHFYQSEKNILMGITPPTISLPKTYPEADQEVITLVSNVMNNSELPIFYYFNQAYPGDDANNPLSTPISNHLGDIRLIKIYLEINTDPEKSPENIKTQSFVELRNLNDYNQVQ